MAFSWQESVKPAGTQDIQCDIEYLDKSYIHVYLDGAETTAFTWTSSTNIRLNSPLSAETAVLLIRKTEREYLYIEFASGAPFIEVNVDTQNTQLLHLAQELVEGRSIEGFYGDVNMHRYRITNLGDPVDARDATNKQYVDAGDARLDQRIDAEHAAWVAAVANEASIRKAADDALDVRTTNLEQTYFNANTNSFPWWTVLPTDTDTVVPGMPFTKAKVRINGVTQTAGYSYTVTSGVIKFASVLPAGTLVDCTIGIDTEADTGAVASILGMLATSAGASYIGTTYAETVQQSLDRYNSTLKVINRRQGNAVNVMDYMTAEQVEDLKLPDPVLDHSSAFTAALADSHYVTIPPGQYNVGDVVIPDYSRLDGMGTPVYTASTLAALANAGTVIRRVSSASCIFKFNLYISFHSINFWGAGGPWMLKRNTAADIQRIVFSSCGMYNSTAGVGLSSGYCKEVDAINCHLANNVLFGWRNTIDSKVIGGYINANNGSGVSCMTGANDNTFIGVKNEWNSGIGYEFFGSTSNTIVGGITDRSGDSGLSYKNNSSVTVQGGVWRRNGRNVLGTRACSHFYGEGARLVLGGVFTAVGADDDGSGAITPNYVLGHGGASNTTTLLVTGSVLSGFVTAATSFSPTPATMRIQGNIGVDDLINVGADQRSGGRSHFGRTVTSLGGYDTATVVVAHSSVPDNTVLRRRLLIEARNTSAGTFATCVLEFHIGRNTAGSTVLQIPNTETPSSAGIGTAGTTLLLSGLTASASGDTVSVTIQNLAAAPWSITTTVKDV